jgi:amino acid transporter
MLLVSFCSVYPVSYLLVIGWLCVVTWQTSIAGGAFVAAGLIQGLFALNIESYESERWHGSLLMLGFILAAIIFNTFLARKLPMIEGIFVIIHILGIVIFFPQLFLSPRSRGAFPLLEFYNPSGWSSNGLATMVGASGPITALIGFDCSVHMGIFSS